MNIKAYKTSKDLRIENLDKAIEGAKAKISEGSELMEACIMASQQFALSPRDTQALMSSIFGG